jgi:hypothetical protein
MIALPFPESSLGSKIRVRDNAVCTKNIYRIVLEGALEHVRYLTAGRVNREALLLPRSGIPAD